MKDVAADAAYLVFAVAFTAGIGAALVLVYAYAAEVEWLRSIAGQVALVCLLIVVLAASVGAVVEDEGGRSI